MISPEDCDGFYYEVPVPQDDPGLTTMRCTGCGAWLVIIKGRGFSTPAGLTQEEAVRQAFSERAAS